jgi:DNA-binding NarL/FixJ family response regulator
MARRPHHVMRMRRLDAHLDVAGGPRSLRVVLGDTDPVVRAGLRALVAGVDDLELAGEVPDLVSAPHRARELRADVVVVELTRGVADSLAVVRSIARGAPDAHVLVLAGEHERERLRKAVELGVRGWVDLGADEEELLTAMRAVGRGAMLLAPAVADHVRELATEREGGAGDAFPQLSRRERQVLELLADGASNAQIAQTLYLSPKTIRNHLSAICNKLQVVDRVQAALRAREAGLGAPRSLDGKRAVLRRVA